MEKTISIDSYIVKINYDCFEINDFIQNLFSPWHSDDKHSDYDFNINKIKDGYLLTSSDFEIFCDNTNILFSHLEYSLTILAKNNLNKYLQFHASCIDLNGNGALIVGHQGSGKTTLAVSSIINGFKSLGDDIVLIKNCFGKVKGFPRPFKLTDYTFKMIPKEFLKEYPHYYIEKDLTYFFFNIPQNEKYADNTHLKCIIFPIITDGQPKIRQIGQTEALMKIMPHSFSLFENRKKILKKLLI